MADRSSTQRSHGFTLVEVIVVVSILGLVAAAIAATFTVIVRTNPSSQERADDARALLNLTRWLPDDVASTYTYPYFVTPDRPNGFVPNGSQPRCETDAAERASLLNLSWTESATTYFVDYFWVRNGAQVAGLDQGRIVRFSCFGTLAAGATSATEAQNMTDVLTELPGDVVPIVVTPIEPPFLNDSTSSIVGGVSFAVSVWDDQEGRVRDILELVAVSKNVQGAELDAVTGGGSGIFPNLEPPVASDLIVEMHPDTIVSFDLPVYDYDGTLDRLVITTTVPVEYVGWAAVPTTESADPHVTITAPADAVVDVEYVIPYTVVDRDGGPGWLSDDGTITVRVIDTSLTPADPIEVLPPPPPPPCTVAFNDPGALSPNPVELKKANNNPTNDVNTLNDSVSVQIIRSGACEALVLRFQPDPLAGITEFETFDNSTEVLIAKNRYQWRVGPRGLELVELKASGHVVHDTATLTVEYAS